MSFMPAMSRLDEEKYSHLPSADQLSSWSGASSKVTRRSSPVSRASTYTSPLPVRVEMKASERPSGEYSGRLSVAGWATSKRASPPATGLVQMSPPETKASSVRLGDTAGSEKYGTGVGAACADWAISNMPAKRGSAWPVVISCQPLLAGF